MKPLHIETPLLESRPLSSVSGKTVFLKMESSQPTGSFKIRGIGHLAQTLVSEGKGHLISSSGGNAGLATAYAGRRLGIPVTVFVPETSGRIFLDPIAAEGATIKVHGKVWDESDQAARAYVKETGGGYIPPFDHPLIWEGHSSIIDEIAKETEKPDVIVVAVGGGGLLCGVLEGLHRNDWKDVPVYGVETYGAASLKATLEARELITLPKIETVATSLGAKRVTAKALEWSKQHSIVPITVSDKEAVEACSRFADDHRVLVEPACGAALSVIYNDAKQLEACKSVVVIVCGGVGVSMNLLVQWTKQV